MNIFLKPEIAKEYDEYYQSDFGKKIDRKEKKMISDLLEKMPQGKMTELGCGTGHWTDFFASRGFFVQGVDISEVMLEIAKKKKINAEFLLANSENLPFNSETRSIVSSITMLEFVEDQESVINEIYRILKNGGYFLFGGLNSRSIIGKNKDEDEVFKHARLWDIHEIYEKFQRFKLIEIRQGVYLDPDYSFMESVKSQRDAQPVFIAALFQKPYL